MSDPYSIVPFQLPRLETRCAWAPEPVFTVEEAARVLGTTKSNILRHVRHRHPEVKLPAKVFANLANTFGCSLTEYGEVRVSLDTPGGPQDHICLTHYGLFRLAVYIRTDRARRFCLNYPDFLCGITIGRIRPPVKTARQYQWILCAPPRQLTTRVGYVAAESGVSRKTIWGHLVKIRRGCVDRDGMPKRIKPGPPPRCPGVAGRTPIKGSGLNSHHYV